MIPRLRELISVGVVVLAVSSGFEMAIKHNLVAGLSLGTSEERISKFEVASDTTGEVLGYVNTDTNLPPIHRVGTFIGTTLHGPVLSKNTELLEAVLGDVAAHAGVKLNPIQDAKKADLLAGLVAEVWKLEEELANE